MCFEKESRQIEVSTVCRQYGKNIRYQNKMHWFVRLALLDFDMILIIGTRPEKLRGLSRGPRHRARDVVCKTHTGYLRMANADRRNVD